MIKSSFKIALRSLLAKKGFSALNIVGLAIGMAACLAIFHYAAFELSFDDFHKNAGRTYRMVLERTAEGEAQEISAVPGLFGDLIAEFNEVESVVRFYPTDYQNNVLLVDSEESINSVAMDWVYYADPNFQEVADLSLVSGDISSFNEPNRMIITRDVAMQLFKDGNALNQTVRISSNIGQSDYMVAGILENPPRNTDFQFKVLLSMPTLPINENPDALTSRDQYGFRTYAVVSESANLQLLEQKIMSRLIEGNDEISWKSKLVPIQEVHFMPYSLGIPGNRDTVFALVGIGIFILILAWVNYINLSITRAMERAREVGVRKVLGAEGLHLKLQFLGEALMLNMLAAGLAFTIVQFSLPYLQRIGNAMEISDVQMPWFVTGCVVVVTAGALLSGIYPALIMSRYKPSEVIKASFRSKAENIVLRKGLVIFQFAVSVILIIGTYTVYTQVRYMKDLELGMNIDRTLVLKAPPGDLSSEDFNRQADEFKKILTGYTFIEGMTATSSIPGVPVNWGSQQIKRPGDDSEIIQMVNLVASDVDYLPTLEIKLLAGRFYAEGDNTFGRGDIIINKKAMEQFGYTDPVQAIGEKLEGGQMFPELTIVGIVENYHHLSARNDYEPMLYVLSIWANYYIIRLREDVSISGNIQNLRSNISQIESLWKKSFPEAPFDYFFLDDQFNKQYASDENFNRLFSLFASIAIVIAILGLFGLSAYEVFQRTREIGIRKVLGASTDRIVIRLSANYVLLVLISGLLSIPIAWYAANLWLSNYSFRADIPILVFLLPVIGVCVLAIITVSFQVYRAAGKNPVDVLKYE